jgi:hypothetical protein
MKATNSKDGKSGQTVVRRAEKAAFLSGFLEGFSGPIMMGKEHRIPVPRKNSDGTFTMVVRMASSGANNRIYTGLYEGCSRVVALSLGNSTDEVMNQRGLQRVEQSEFYIDRNGKRKTLKRTVPVLRGKYADT